jgi:hypothetical protein
MHLENEAGKRDATDQIPAGVGFQRVAKPSFYDVVGYLMLRQERHLRAL